MSVDFLVVGHMTHDRTPDGFRLGGTVSYSAVTARRLGRHPAILTRAAMNRLLTVADLEDGAANVTGIPGSPLAGVPIHMLPSPVTTTFVNLYREGQRTQVVEALAGPLDPQELPSAWAEAPVVLLGPLVREIPPAWVHVFPKALIGLTPQGWMRQWDAAGHVSPAKWANAPEFLGRADVVILSREDVDGDEAYIASLAAQARLMVVTDGWRGASIYRGGERAQVAPRPTHEIDPTGAGDVFATAFLIRLAETGDPFVAARFANVVASLSVEAVGMDAIPYRAQVDEWLERVE